MTSAFAGNRGFSWANPILDSFAKTFNNGTKMQFPINPRNYTLNNFTIASKMLPPLSTKFKVDFKHWMKVVAVKTRKMEFAASLEIYGKLNHE